MRIYCSRCKKWQDYKEAPSSCWTCGLKDLGFEEDPEWDSLSRFFVGLNGWDRRGDLSLPQFVERKPAVLTAWEEFKSRLTDFEAIPPPVRCKSDDAVDFYTQNSGISDLVLHRTCTLTVSELYRHFPILKKLAANYVALWDERGRLVHRENKGRSYKISYSTGAETPC